jgi:pectate lyase
MNRTRTPLSRFLVAFCLGVFAISRAAPDFKLIGYGALDAEGINGTSGGAGGKTVLVGTLAGLEAWAAGREKNTAPEILRISGRISASGSTLITVKNGANITIEGVGRTGELLNVGLNIRDYKNVIVRNLVIHEVEYPNDALTLDNVQHGWVERCELYSRIGPGIGVDTYDGLLDIKKGSRYITISWNHLHHHMKCSLVGHTDNQGQQEEDSRIRVTYHHNWFHHTDGRNPSLRFGAVHMFNNVFEDITDYGIAARAGAHAKLENNVYHNVKLPMSTDKFPVEGLPNGFICEAGNVLSGTTGAKVISQTGCEFWNAASLPYGYVLDPIAKAETEVRQHSGLGDNPVAVLSPAEVAPAWASGMISTFDLQGRRLRAPLSRVVRVERFIFRDGPVGRRPPIHKLKSPLPIR